VSRHAVIVGNADGEESGLEQTLQRYAYSRISRLETVAEALELISKQHLDLLIVPIDAVDELQLAALDRASRRERHTGIIATGTRADPELMLRAMRAGIQEFLVRPLVLTDAVAAVERLHRRTHTGVVSGQNFAVYSAKGGVGASTVAVNLAYALSAHVSEARVAIADLAIPGGDVKILLNVRPAYDLGDVAGKPDRLDAELLNSVLVPATDGLWVLAAPERPEADEAIDAGVVASILQHLRASFNFTVTDCDSPMSDRTLVALDDADRILLVTELKVPAMRAAQRTLGIFRRLGYPNEKLCIVVNRYQSNDVLTASDATNLLKADIFMKLPNDYKSASESATSGVPIIKSHPDSRLAVAYQQFAQKLVGGPSDEQTGGEPANGSMSVMKKLFSRRRT